MAIPIKRFSEVEIKWAIEQLTGAGYLEVAGENVKMTDAGITYALEMERSLGIQAAFMLMMLNLNIQDLIDGEESGGALHD